MDVLPLHQAMLGVITFAAGSELELDAVRANARIVSSIATALTVSALVFVFSLHLLFTSLSGFGADGENDELAWTRRCVSSMLAAVVAIARSPSSAIGVVTETQADGPFTQMMLTVTMVTDVVVVVLFLLAAEMAEAMLSPDPFGILHAIIHFAGRMILHLSLSVGLAALLCTFCLLVLRLPHKPRALRPLALLAVGWLAFSAERLLHVLLRNHETLNELIRLEPMLSCLLAGSAIVSVFGRRRAFGHLVHSCLPLVLCFFFLTTGMSMDLSALWHSWPLACGLFLSRLLSLRVGYSAGAALATRSWTSVGGAIAQPPAALGPAAAASKLWLAFITQAGVGLGLAEEIGVRFAPWAEGLHTSLVASIVLNQIAGPPLLRYALQQSGEAGRSQKRDKLIESLTHRLNKENPKALESITDAALAIAGALATAATVTAADAAKSAASMELLDAHGWINVQRGSGDLVTPLLKTPIKVDTPGSSLNALEAPTVPKTE